MEHILLGMLLGAILVLAVMFVPLLIHVHEHAQEQYRDALYRLIDNPERSTSLRLFCSETRMSHQEGRHYLDKALKRMGGTTSTDKSGRTTYTFNV